MDLSVKATETKVPELIEISQSPPSTASATTVTATNCSINTTTNSSKVTMLNYFEKVPSKACVVQENPRKSAPIFNKQHVDEFQSRKTQFDDELARGLATTDYFSSIKFGQHVPYRINRPPRGSLRARLFQYHEDVRPPYFGTWQKRSKLVTGRRPYGLDTEVFDYEVDSEAEWDIGGPGESLKGDDSDDEEEQDDYEIDMKTFVPHGYVSDDEIESDKEEENQSANQSIEERDCDANNDSDSDVKIISEVKTQKQQAEQQQQAPKQTPKMDIKPIVIGINYEDNPSISETKSQFLRTFQGFSCSVKD